MRNKLDTDHETRKAMATRVEALLDTEQPIAALTEDTEVREAITDKSSPLRAIILRKVKRAIDIDPSFLGLQAKGKTRAFRGCPYSAEALESGVIPIVQLDAGLKTNEGVPVVQVVERLTDETGIIIQFPQSAFPDIYELSLKQFSFLKEEILKLKDELGFSPEQKTTHNIFAQGPVYAHEESTIKSRRAAYYQIVVAPRKLVSAKGSELRNPGSTKTGIDEATRAKTEKLRAESPFRAIVSADVPFMPAPWDPL